MKKCPSNGNIFLTDLKSTTENFINVIKIVNNKKLQNKASSNKTCFSTDRVEPSEEAASIDADDELGGETGDLRRRGKANTCHRHQKITPAVVRSHRYVAN